MADLKLMAMEVRGVSYDVFVGEDGKFRADPGLPGEEVPWPSSDTLEGLRKTLLEKSRRRQAKVSVPFVGVQYPTTKPVPEIRKGVATGFHASTGKILVTWAGGKSEQYDPFRDTFRPLSDEEKQEFLRLEGEYRKAREKWEAFKGVVKINLHQEVRTAIEAAVAKLENDEKAKK